MNPDEDVVQNYFSTQIETLKSMFGDLVSTAVIVAVLESCDGDVNIAAEGLMNLTHEVNALSIEENSTETSSSTATCRNISAGTHVIDHNHEKNVPNYHLNPAAPEFQPVSNLSKISSSIAPIGNVPSPCKEDFPPLSKTRNLPSYTTDLQGTGAVPKHKNNANQNDKIKNSKSTEVKNSRDDPIERILNHHNKGSRVLVIMRGVPGSGKSFMARTIIQTTVGSSLRDYNAHIFSTDDYFVVRGRYLFNKNYLHEAHLKNQRKVSDALNVGVSPVIVDNTHVCAWEMTPYVRDAVRNGYYLEIVEPYTPWRRNINQLARRNVHNVPKDKIKQMVENYENNITPEYLLKSLNLTYPINKTPPVLRNIPPFIPMETNPQILDDDVKSEASNNINPIVNQVEDKPNQESHTNIEYKHVEQFDNNKDVDNIPECTSYSEVKNIVLEDVIQPETKSDIQKQIEEFETIEREWDDGESWETDETKPEPQTKNIPTPKPPRHTAPSNNEDKILESANIGDDWTKISMFLPPWQDNAASVSSQYVKPCVETVTVGTGFEIGDTDNFYDMYRTVDASARNINENYSYDTKIERIPNQRTFDKSTSTHDRPIIDNIRCQNEEKHFIAFRRMFRTIPRTTLRDIFDNCLGDVNWAVNIVLDGIGENQLQQSKGENISDDEEEDIIECDCLAAYNIIPDTKPTTPISPIQTEISQTTEQSSPLSLRKPKRERKYSEGSMEIKRQIESNIVISENHYSQHYLSLKRAREAFSYSPEQNTQKNNVKVDEVVKENIQTELKNTEEQNVTCVVETIPNNNYINAVPSTSGASVVQSHLYHVDNLQDDTDLDSNSPDHEDSECEVETVTVNLGMDFVKKLDEIFDRSDIIYPENIKPTFSIPKTLLFELEALWAESVAFQLDNASRQTEEMVKQDEEFARELALKEKQMAQEGAVSKFPDFREIMDMDLALSIYEKDVAEWRKAEPQNLAAKLTRKKLFDLFPCLSEDTLSEILMAHDNNFKNTVQSLLISTGQGHVLNEQNGIEKFIMEKEIEKKEMILAVEKKNMEKEPFLPMDGVEVDMDMVNEYRAKANEYRKVRSELFNKAKNYFNQNQLSVAAFYSDIASSSRRRWEIAQSLAAASLIQYHASRYTNSNLLDLHYMRVAEARETLDIFLDSKIRRMRETRSGGPARALQLYVVTGRGNHSAGAPRIKPAVQQRLKARKLKFIKRNDGLLCTIVNHTSLLTNEINKALL